MGVLLQAYSDEKYLPTPHIGGISSVFVENVGKK